MDKPVEINRFAYVAHKMPCCGLKPDTRGALPFVVTDIRLGNLECLCKTIHKGTRVAFGIAGQPNEPVLLSILRRLDDPDPKQETTGREVEHVG